MSAAAVKLDVPRAAPPVPRRVVRYAGAAAACGITTLLALPLARLFDPPNIVMLFLLAVLIVAMTLGRGPAVVSAFLSVALFDFFFVPPTFSFTVHDAQYLLTFAAMLAVALVIGHLTAGLKEQAAEASARERRTSALYGMARGLAGAATAAQAAAIVQRFVAEAAGGAAVVFLRTADGKADVVETPGAIAASRFDAPLVELAMVSGEAVELDFDTYVPLLAKSRVHGVLAVAYDRAHAPFMPQQRELLAAVGALVAIVAERLVAEDAHAQRVAAE